jgi:PDZ domain-containing protein
MTPRLNLNRSQRIVTTLVLALLVMVTAIGITSQIKTSFVRVTPGPVYNLAASLTGPNLNTELSSQALYLTTVDAKRLSIWDYVINEVHPSGQLEITNTSAPTISTAQSDMIELGLLQSSKDVALIVAQNHVIGQSALTPVGAKVLYISPGSPAANSKLRTNDVISAVGDTKITSDTDLTAALATQNQTPVELTVTRGAQTLHIVLPTGQKDVINSGLTTATATVGTSPYNVDLSGVGGPSGGLLLALTYTTAMTSGSLTGNHVVAGTGTISTTGQVGSIAGIADKVHAAAAAGATVFFAPATDSFDAKTAAKGTKLTVVPVTTYTQALTWLCDHGSKSSACQISK